MERLKKNSTTIVIVKIILEISTFSKIAVNFQKTNKCSYNIFHGARNSVIFLQHF